MTQTPSAPSGNGKRSDARADPESPGTADRIGSLRGPSVQFDRRRVGRVVAGVSVATLVVLIVVFTVAGVHSNNQIDTLHDRGVPVTVTVTGCLGLLGGSGSNAAGYSCHGAFTLDGRRYAESLPGTAFHRPGSTIPSVVVPGDPALVSPVDIVDSEHSSAGVFVLPAVLTGILVVLVVLVAWRMRGGRRDDPAAADPAR
jgi:hypothetical protein